MRKVLTFGPAFGLPDPSPFCLKAIVLLQLAKLEYQTAAGDPTKAPKKKIPVLIEDDGRTVPDTTLMRFYLEDAYSVNFDAGLSEAQKGIGWAFEKLCEDHLYFALMYERWMIDANFDRGPRQFFQAVPTPMRPLVTSLVRRQVKRDLWGHGVGRHTLDEICRMANRGFDAIDAQLGAKPWLMGDKPCGADASVWACVAAASPTVFNSPITNHVLSLPKLTAYRDRGLAMWFPDFKFGSDTT